MPGYRYSDEFFPGPIERPSIFGIALGRSAPHVPQTPYRDGEALPGIVNSMDWRIERARFLQRIGDDRREIERLNSACKVWQEANSAARAELHEAREACTKMRKALADKNTAYAEASMLLNRAEDALKKAHAV